MTIPAVISWSRWEGDGVSDAEEGAGRGGREGGGSREEGGEKEIPMRGRLRSYKEKLLFILLS